jgi:hypothetical protein
MAKRPRTKRKQAKRRQEPKAGQRSPRSYSAPPALPWPFAATRSKPAPSNAAERIGQSLSTGAVRFEGTAQPFAAVPISLVLGDNRPNNLPHGNRPNNLPHGNRAHNLPQGNLPNNLPHGNRPHNVPGDNRGGTLRAAEPVSFGAGAHLRPSTRLRAVSSLLDGGLPAAHHPTVTMGWHPDLPDSRDKALRKDSPDHLLAARQAMAKSAHGRHLPADTRTFPRQHENLQWCSPVEDQGPLGSCTAQVVVGLIEFMQRRAGGEHIDGSRLFLY